MKVRIEGILDKGYGKQSGGKIIADKILKDDEFASGIKCRVINLWKRPRYIDFGWFK